MRLVCISDTHGMHRDIAFIPNGDVLIHSGDCLGRGSISELEDFIDWLGELPHRHKILIAGNHDWCFQTHPEESRSLVTNAIYLEDSGVSIEGLKFWGSPITPTFRNWAFNRERGSEIAQHWALIPDDTDVLVTHGPPEGIFDAVIEKNACLAVGCRDLYRRIDQLNLRAHVFGHIHESYGVGTREKDNVIFVNACICTKAYCPINPPIVIDIPV
ncbi:metallophosphatase domain-containing protein [Marinobacter sp.]|uniref:metallophosphatase domain-containing protein n=1 Tax=Marinobacter sp. TaxID=50741 RepID=UPI000C3FBE67|nr:metallophosphatase domain-containing protein [Marinobacter sp.]MBE94714.1 metallophosphoesterase [Marinobacter sp.]